LRRRKADNIIYLADKVQIHPRQEALKKLWDVSYNCKNVWNRLNQAIKEEGRKLSELKGMLPALKQEDERLKAPSSQVLQEVALQLGEAWKSFWSKRKNGDKDANPPGYKSYKFFFTHTYPQYGVSFEFAGNVLRLAYGKNKRDWIEIEIPERGYPWTAVKTIRIQYDKSQNKWYAILTREVKVPEVRQDGHVIFFDPGCRTTLTGIKTDFTVHEYDLNPLRRANLKLYSAIDVLKSQRDHKQKGSRRWRRLNARIRRIHRIIRTRTHHYIHKLASRILEDHPDVREFRVGDWNKQETLADTGYRFVDRHINRLVQNLNPVRKLVDCLNYKARRLAQAVRDINEQGTSDTCLNCDHVLPKGLPISHTVFRCPVCGFHLPRDILAGFNMLKKEFVALWQGLRGKKSISLSIVRISLDPISGENRRPARRTITFTLYSHCTGMSFPGCHPEIPGCSASV